MKHPVRSQQGSMLISLSFMIVALMISSVIISLTLAGNLNARASASKQTQRFLLSAVIGALDTSVNRQESMPLYSITNTSLMNGPWCKKSSASFSPDAALKDVSWKWCLSPERLGNERYLEGMKAIITITPKGGKTRYYRAHLRGLANAITYADTASDGNNRENTFSDLVGARYGFTTANIMEIGTNGGGVYTYTVDTSTAIKNSAPVIAHALTLGQTLPSDEVLLNRFRYDIAGGTCNGAGCAGTTFRDIPFPLISPSLDGPYQEYFDPDSPYSQGEKATPKCSEGVTWRSSENGNTLSSTTTTGACFKDLIFDSNTTINGDSNTIWVADGGAIIVEPGIQVNMQGKSGTTTSMPDARNLKIISGSQGWSQTSSYMGEGATLVMGAGSKMAAMMSARSCTVEAISYYGSLHCYNKFEGKGSKFYYQKELESTPIMAPPYNSSTPSQEWWMYDGSEKQYAEVTAEEAAAS